MTFLVANEVNKIVKYGKKTVWKQLPLCHLAIRACEKVESILMNLKNRQYFDEVKNHKSRMSNLGYMYSTTTCYAWICQAVTCVCLCAGLVQDLDLHRDDCAGKYLSVPGTYVLVRKQPTSSGQDNDDETTETTYNYIPLLNNCNQLLPGYRVQRTAGGPGEAARRRQTDGRRKSQSPAGTKPTKSKQTKDRTPSKKR